MSAHERFRSGVARSRALAGAQVLQLARREASVAEALKALERFADLTNILVAHFQHPSEIAEDEIAELLAAANVESLIGNVETEARERGIGSARTFLDTAISDPQIGLTSPQREALVRGCVPYLTSMEIC